MADLRPNHTFERTRRFTAPTWLASARRVAQLGRWASGPSAQLMIRRTNCDLARSEVTHGMGTLQNGILHALIV